jgi:hypothetical protein
VEGIVGQAETLVGQSERISVAGEKILGHLAKIFAPGSKPERGRNLLRLRSRGSQEVVFTLKRAAPSVDVDVDVDAIVNADADADVTELRWNRTRRYIDVSGLGVASDCQL